MVYGPLIFGSARNSSDPGTVEKLDRQAVGREAEGNDFRERLFGVVGASQLRIGEIEAVEHAQLRSLGSCRGRVVIAQRFRVVACLVELRGFTHQGIDRHSRQIDFVGARPRGRLRGADLSLDHPVFRQRRAIPVERRRCRVDAVAANPCHGLGDDESGLDVRQRKIDPERSFRRVRGIERRQRPGEEVLGSAHARRAHGHDVELGELVRGTLQQSGVEGFRRRASAARCCHRSPDPRR